MQILSGISASEGIFYIPSPESLHRRSRASLGAPWLHDNLPVHHYRNASIFHAFELIPAAMVVGFPFAPAALGDRFVLQVGQYPTILQARKKDISIPAVERRLRKHRVTIM